MAKITRTLKVELTVTSPVDEHALAVHADGLLHLMENLLRIQTEKDWHRTIRVGWDETVPAELALKTTKS